MTLNDADDVGWAVIKAFCDEVLDDLELSPGSQFVNHEAAVAVQAKFLLALRICLRMGWINLGSSSPCLLAALKLARIL